MAETKQMHIIPQECAGALKDEPLAYTAQQC